MLPDSYCTEYNAVGTCAIPNCTRLHTLYSYTSGTSVGHDRALSSEHSRVEGGNVGRYSGNRTPPQDISGSRWK